MQSNDSTIVILGTGGTIAGTASGNADGIGYTAAQRGVDDLVAAVPALADRWLDIEQVAQIDSKDMSHAVWQRLAQRLAHHLARSDVSGVVVTHGTDTLEETAWFLQRVLAPAKPVVLTAAMKPADSPEADGPRNLADAVSVAATLGASGVVVVMAGAVHGAADVRKRHPQRVDAFDSGENGPIGFVEDGDVRLVGHWPAGEALGLDRIALPAMAWPRVEIVTAHAGADGAIVRALKDSGVQGLVVAATGNGTLHHALAVALREAAAAGVRVLRSTRCAEGAVTSEIDELLPSAGGLSPWQARIELLLDLLKDGIRPTSA